MRRDATRHRVFVALGSNLGDRHALIGSAVARLDRLPRIAVARLSSILETDPVGGSPQPKFLNAVCEVETSLPARPLLDALLEIERRLGRVRAERFGPRTIDLDLLLYDDAILEERGLTVPHPRLAERRFVLEPLVEIAPDVRHPQLGRTMLELWNELLVRGRS